MALADLVVVMNNGRIAQAGTPREVFNHPRDAFVARFIGGHNVLARSVGGVEQQFAVRTDRIRILPPGSASAGANSLAGQVRLVEYQGPMVHLRLASPGVDEFTVAVTQDGQVVYDSGRVQWVHPFPYSAGAGEIRNGSLEVPGSRQIPWVAPAKRAR